MATHPLRTPRSAVAGPEDTQIFMKTKSFPALISGTGVEAPPKGPAQQGAYIIRNDGGLVWDGYTYFSPWTGNFQAARWNGSDIIFAFEGSHNGLHGHGHGRHVLLNQNYEVIRSLRAGGHFISDKHEFIIINEKTALFQIYQPLQMDLSGYGGDEDQTWIVDAIFQEYTSEGDIAFHAGFGDGPLGEMEQHNYRAFRYNWTGISAETPAVYAEEVDAGTVILYVSWNGDTRTSIWRFSWKEELESRPGQVQVKNQETHRTGFETSLTIRSRGASISQVVAEALDVHDDVLARSDPVSIAIALPKAIKGHQETSELQRVEQGTGMVFQEL
ncbi:hypothetical protein HYQ44_020422 [Verticillium longisporum]|nr:hypothetical protein HYQ44_020422 [Verticillium longisporum]